MPTPPVSIQQQSPGTSPHPAPDPRGQAPEVVLPTRVARFYGESDLVARARLLECLIGALRPLGLVAVAAGAFGCFLHRESWSQIGVSLSDALRYSSEQVYELAHFVEQVQPEAFGRLAALMADHPVCPTTLTGSVLPDAP